MAPKVQHYHYDLRFAGSTEASAEGALLRYEFDDGALGYASLSAWPALGDELLSVKLRQLSENPRLEPVWNWAMLDADLRRQGRSALPADTVLPPSHWHLRREELGCPTRWAELVDAGYRHWKLKVSPRTHEEYPIGELAQYAHVHGVKLRLDANGSFTSIDELTSFFSCLGNTSIVDFMEDPSPQETLWFEIRRRWGVAIASDWLHSSPDVTDLIIYKPGRDSNLPTQKDFVMTTCFDHPLGLNYTAYQSHSLNTHPRMRLPPGIAHPGLYTCDGLSSETTFGEVGFGFGEYLEGLTWAN